MELKQGYKQTELGIIPVDWDIKQISEISNPVRGGSPRPAGDPKFFNGSYIPWLTVAALTNLPVSQIFVYKTETCLTELGSQFSRKLEKGTVIIANSGATLGVAKILGITCCANDGIAALKDVNSGINEQYLVYFINTKIKYLREVVATGNGQPNLNTSLIGLIKVPFPPSHEEQTAIANALSDMDTLISQTEKLIEKKKAIKQGAMQKLLTGRTRLDEFGNQKGYKTTEYGMIPKDWDVKKLGDLGENIIGLTYSPNDVSEYGHLVLRSSNIQNNKLAFVNNVFVDMELPNRVIVKENDILICVRNGSKNLIGKCALIDKATEGCAFGAFMSVYRTQFAQYIYHQFQSTIIQKQIDQVMGATINQLTNKDLSTFKIPVPQNIHEQTAIASVLSDMDIYLERAQIKLTKLKQQKQGMMQALLSGKIRLA